MTEIRPERTDDLPGIRAVHLAAFETPAEADLVDTLRTGDAWRPDLSIVAVTGVQVVAHALLSGVVLATPRGDVPALALGPVAVLPGHHRLGYGTAVVQDALIRRDDRLVVVLGDPDYYRRFGFVPGAGYGVTSAWSSYGDAWQVLPPAAGTGPGEVLYPDDWDKL